MKLNNNSITVSEAAKLLNYKSNQGVIQLIDLKVLPNAYKKDGKWRIPIVDIKNVSKIYENSIGTNEAKRILGYKNTGSIVELIEKSRFPNAFQFLRKWRIPLSDIENIEKNDLLDLTIAQATETLKINRNAVLALLNSNIFPNAYKDFVSKWKIPLADIKEYQKEHDYSDYVDIQKACNFLEAAKSTIYYHLSAGRFPNSFKYGKKWLIHTDDLNDFKKNYEINKIASKPSQNRKSNHKSAISLWDGAHKKDYISVRHASEKLNLTKHSGLKLFQRELPNGLIEYRGRYWVSKSIFDNYLNIKLKNATPERGNYEEDIEVDKKTYKILKEIVYKLNSVPSKSEYLLPVEYLNAFRKIPYEKKNKRINRRDFDDLRDRFYRKVVEEKYGKYNLERIKLGDTRHFAIINMALQGFNMLSIARMAGHNEIRSQHSYYSHAEHFSQSYVYRMTQNHLENELNSRLDSSGIIGWKRYIYDKGLATRIEEDKLDKIVGRVEFGYCTEQKSIFPETCLESCKFCPKFLFKPAINDQDAATKWLSNTSEDLSRKIQENIRLMRDLSINLSKRYTQGNDDLLKSTSKQLTACMDRKAIIDSKLMGDEAIERK